MLIEYTKRQSEKDRLFSILIPTWNNLEYLKLCIKSILKNSVYQHQIIVHINDGSDGTLEWLQQEDIDYTHSSKNIGVCYALNTARSLADTDYLVFVNDDMYLCPEWDRHLYAEIEQAGTKLFYLSGTSIEPVKTANSCCIAPCDYGRNVETFQEEKLLTEFSGLEHADWSGASWPPCVVHKEVWDLIGGYSTEFSPGMYSDPDFSMKLYLAGVRIFKGVSKARAYHFMCRSTNKVRKNNGRRTFLLKYGFTSRQFYTSVLQLGQPYAGCNIPQADDPLWHKLRRSGLVKKLLALFEKPYLN